MSRPDDDLFAAARGGDDERLRSLLDDGAEVDAEDEQGWTPLTWAAGQGHEGVVRLLLERGADATHAGRDNRTPLMIARAAGREGVSDLLRQAEKELGVWEDPSLTRPYCKAYYLRQVAEFAQWPQGVEVESGEGGPSEPVIYLHQDLTVTRSMWHGEDVLFDGSVEGWESFCRGTLEFAVPQDLR